MALHSKEWTGVDLGGDGRFYAARVRPGRGKAPPTVVQCGRTSGVSIDAAALTELAQKVGGKSWTFPLARGDYQMIITAEPPVPDKELESSLRWGLSAMVDYPLDEAVVSWMRIPTEQYQPSMDKQVYAVVARRETIDSQCAPFREARIPLRAVDVRETSLRNVAALLERGGDALALVTVGAQGVTATFTYRGELYLDRFIAQNLEDLLEADEARRTRFFDRLAQQLYQSLDLLARTYPFVSVERIVVAHPSKLAEMVPYLGGKLPVPVEALDLSKVVDLTQAPEAQGADGQLQYLVAIGSAMRGALEGAR